MEFVEASHRECAAGRKSRPTTRSEYASNRAQGALAIRDVVEHTRAQHPIKGGSAWASVWHLSGQTMASVVDLHPSISPGNHAAHQVHTVEPHPGFPSP
jgi:hypothetical protein